MCLSEMFFIAASLPGSRQEKRAEWCLKCDLCPLADFNVLKKSTKVSRMGSLFDALITSKMRVRILQRLFLDAANKAYVRELASEFHASPGHIKQELTQLLEAGLLQSEQNGRQINYKANEQHPLFPELQSMVRKALGMDRVLESIIDRLGSLQAAYLIGDYALGRDGDTIELVLVGDINNTSLKDLVLKAERYVQRRIRPSVVTQAQWQ